MQKQVLASALMLSFCAVVVMASKTGNPLVSKEGYVNFDYPVADMLVMTENAKNFVNERIEEIVKIPLEKRTFKNTVEAFENTMAEFHNRVETFDMAADYGVSPEARKKGEEIRGIEGKFKVDVFTRKDLYDALKGYKDTNPKLNPAQKYVFGKMMFEFEKNGLSLSPEKLAEFKMLKGKIIDLEAKFNSNTNAAKSSIILTEQELKTVSDPNIIAAMKKTKNGKYEFDITMRDNLFLFLQACSDRKLRDKAEKNYTSSAGMSNVKLLEEALVYRQKIAKLMGFETYADYALQDKMAKNFKTSMDFVSNLVSRLKVKEANDNVKFLSLKHEMEDCNKPLVIGQNEWWYLSNEYKKRYLSIDMAKIREYFPTKKVVAKMLDIYGQIYGVKFEKADIPVFHKDVTAYRIMENGKNVGYLYLDLFPRDGKYTHAQSDDLLFPYRLENGDYQYPVSLVMYTVDADTADKPSLLDYEQMSTLFHEFGHAMQQSFNRTPYGFFGANTAQDFVEVPSTIMEHWLDTPQMLGYLSGHYKTGAKLPAATINKLLEARVLGKGHYELWFATRTMFDQLIHSEKGKINAINIYKKAHLETRGHPMIPGAIMPSIFTHPMSTSYAGVYYCYRWAEVIATDLLSPFLKGGVFNPEIGKKFREKIFAPGGTRDENQMVRDFLGRDYKQDAYFESIGVKLN